MTLNERNDVTGASHGSITVSKVRYEMCWEHGDDGGQSVLFSHLANDSDGAKFCKSTEIH